jgi:hypothetical protein
MEDRQVPRQPKGLKRWILDLIGEKKEKTLETRVKTKIKVKSRNLIDLVEDKLQLVMTYVYIGSMTYLFDS